MIFNQYTQKIPKNYILYNFEQLNINYYDKDKYITLSRNAKLILDYSLVNENIWKNGNLVVYHLPWGPVKSLFNPNKVIIEKDIDILFVGVINDRRKKILDIIDKKYNLVILSNVFRDDLETYMRRSKICINIHYYNKNSILEIPRILPMLYHRVKILSEKSIDEYYCNQYDSFIEWFNYDNFLFINEKVEEIIKNQIISNDDSDLIDNKLNNFDINYNNLNEIIEKIIID
jgi:hypothetical protein